MAKTLADYDNDINNATAVLTSATKDAQTKLSNLNRCNCGKGKLAIKRAGIPAGTCAPLTSQVSFPSLADTSNCIDPDSIASCKTDCCSKSTCISNVNTYNSAIGVYNAAVQNLAVANKAKADAIATDPSIANEVANRKTKNAVIITIVIAVVAIVVFIVWRKYGK